MYMSETEKIMRYDIKEKMHVATDCIIIGFEKQKLKLLLFRRKAEPMKGKWSLIGSTVRLEEGLDTAAQRILKESTGLEKIFLCNN